MGRRLHVSWGKLLLILILLYILYVILCVALPPLTHKTVTAGTACDFQAEGSGTERILCLDDNVEALSWRLRVIESAREEIILSTFDFRDDSSGRDMMSALLQASKRGVQVKILIDGINGFLFLKNNTNFKALVSQPGVEAKFYNPVNLLTPWKLNYRMHDKYVIADDAVYILGGRNTNDLFLGNYSEKQNVDRDILVYETEPGAENTLTDLLDYFDSVWNLSCCRSLTYKASDTLSAAAEELEAHYASLKGLYPEAFGETDWEAETWETQKITLCTNPIQAENKEPVLWDEMQQLMESGDEVLIQTPYVICSQDMYDGLAALEESGTRIELMINAIESGANPFGCIDYVNEKEKVLGTGMVVYECIGSHSTHTKTILVDDRLSAVGSYNLDMRSTYLDTEMMLVIDCPRLNASLREQAEALKLRGKQVLPDGETIVGENYPEVSLSGGKKLFYQILKIVIRPFRQIL